MIPHETNALFDRDGKGWPEPSSQRIVCTIQFELRTDDPGFTALVRITDAARDVDLEWSDHPLAYTIGGWAQAMALVAWQLERSQHYLETFT